jgi:Transposase DDE domain
VSGGHRYSFVRQPPSAAVVSCASTQTTASRSTEEQIAAEAALDGISVMRTSVPGAELKAPDVVRAYKQRKEVERVLCTLKGRLELRPIHHRLEQRVKAHVFLCLLSYYLAWHLREDWKPLLFDDEQPPTQPDPVAKASRSTAAKCKTQTKRTTAGEPCHSAHRALDPRPKHDPPAGHRRQLRAAHTTHTHPGPSSS